MTFDIGPNLLSAILAITALGTSVVSLWRAENMAKEVRTQAGKIESNRKRILEVHNKVTSQNNGSQEH